MMEFLEGDVRFIVGDQTEDIHRLCRAVVCFFTKDKVSKTVLCYDARLSSPDISTYLKTILLSAGIDVVTTDRPVSSCLFYQTCLNEQCGGIMITASHNPKEYNGLKLVAQKLVPITAAQILPFYQEDNEVPLSSRQGTVTKVDLTEAYVETARRESQLSGDANISVLVDFLHGSSATETLSGLRRFSSLKVTALHQEPDGSFPCGPPNPMVASSLTEFFAALKQGPYDLGFVLDGDGDRVAVYSGDGRKVEPSTLLFSFLQAGFFPTGSRILVDGRTPNAFFTSETDLSKTGHVFVKQTMLTHPTGNYQGAAEQSGHFFYRIGENVVESSLLTIFRTIKLYMKNRTLLLSNLTKQEQWITPAEITVRGKNAEHLAEKTITFFKKQGCTLLTTDRWGEKLGYQLLRGNGFSLYQRISQTEHDTLRWQIVAVEGKSATAVATISRTPAQVF